MITTKQRQARAGFLQGCWEPIPALGSSAREITRRATWSVPRATMFGTRPYCDSGARLEFQNKSGTGSYPLSIIQMESKFYGFLIPKFIHQNGSG